ncbi:MAG TPA: zf-HC2 domain-containing protein [Caulobacteraceae bacterium]|jgi:hypothetical protein
MADIIRLNGDPHAQTQHLLPWYVTGGLTGKELSLVEDHLGDCAECREDMEIEKTLARHVRAMPCDIERGWQTLRARLDGAPPGRPAALARKAKLFGRQIPIGWAVAAQAASLAVLAPLLALSLMRPPLLYRTLGSAPPTSPGNLIVVFRPKAPEAALRAILIETQARIVDGPTGADAYVLQVAPERRPAVLARLRGDSDISLAEPIEWTNR